MFRSFIYLDEEKLYTYKRQLDGGNKPKIKTVSKKKSASITAGLSGFGVQAGTETDVQSEFEKDISYDYHCFETALADYEGEEYFDFVTKEHDIMSIPPMKLFRIWNSIEIPESFDNVKIIKQFMPMLMDQINMEAPSEQEALKAFLGEASAEIPLLIHLEGTTIAAKLNWKYLQEEYSALEDYSEQEVYMLCKFSGIVRKKTVEIFDPLKDYIKLPRAMRRKMDSKEESIGIDKIIIDGPVIKAEVIAIYK